MGPHSALTNTLRPFIPCFFILICPWMWGPDLETKYDRYKSQPADQRIHQGWIGFRQPFDLCLSARGATCIATLLLALGELPLGRPHRLLPPQLLGRSSFWYQLEKYLSFSSPVLTRIWTLCPSCLPSQLVWYPLWTWARRTLVKCHVPFLLQARLA